MKNIIFGGLLILIGLFIGLYVGLWWAFIGGIVAVIEQIRAAEIDSTVLAIGIAKICFASFLGGISAFIFVMPGMALITHRAIKNIL